MTSPQFSPRTQREIDHLVRRVSRAAGSRGDEPTYRDKLQTKMDQKSEKLHRKMAHYQHLLSLAPSDADFTEELRAYIADGMADLMASGMSEDEALAATAASFDTDDADLDLASSLQDIGEITKPYLESLKHDASLESQEWFTRNGDVIGLFWAAFMMLGMVGGTLIGFLASHDWIGTLIGFGFGVGFGVGLSLLSNAIIRVRRG